LLEGLVSLQIIPLLNINLSISFLYYADRLAVISSFVSFTNDVLTMAGLKQKKQPKRLLF
jgi:hypothetical protein